MEKSFYNNHFLLVFNMSVTYLDGDVIGNNEVLVPTNGNEADRPEAINIVADDPRPEPTVRFFRQPDPTNIERLYDASRLIPGLDLNDLLSENERNMLYSFDERQISSILNLINRNILTLLDGVSVNALVYYYERILLSFYPEHIARQITKDKLFYKLVSYTFWMIKWALPRLASKFSIVVFLLIAVKSIMSRDLSLLFGLSNQARESMADDQVDRFEQQVQEVVNRRNEGYEMDMETLDTNNNEAGGGEEGIETVVAEEIDDEEDVMINENSLDELDVSSSQEE